MNRQQRREAKYKREQRDRNYLNGSSTGGLGLIKLTQTYTDDEYRRLSAGTRMAWYKLCNGLGTQDDFDMVATSMNVAAVIARGIDDLVLDAVEQAMVSLVAMQDRYKRTGKFGPDGLALQTVAHGLDVYDEILKNSTPLQTVSAVRTATKMVHKGAVLRLEDGANFAQV